MTAAALPLVRYAAVPEGAMLHIQPPLRYDSLPPSLFDLRGEDVRGGGSDAARMFLRVLARIEVPVPAEAVMRFRDVVVLDGRVVVSRAGAVAESLAGADVAEMLRRYPALARAGGAHLTPANMPVEDLPVGGAPVAAVFQEGAEDFAALVVDVLPRLVHLAEMGVRELRLLVPERAAAWAPVVAFALEALGMRAELVACPEGSAVRVAELIWVTPVSYDRMQSSPTLLRLMARLRGAVAADGPARMFAVAGDGPEDAALATVAGEAGFAAVAPAALPVARQVALFAACAWVVGLRRPGLVLSAAMAPGGRVTVIDTAPADHVLWDLACLAGLRFDWVFEGHAGVDAELVREVLAGS